MFIRTQRLLLRPGWSEDAPALFGAVEDEGIVRNLANAPWPYQLEDAHAFLAKERKPSQPSLLIFLRGEKACELAGSIGFGVQPGGGTEFGYWIARPHWNRGYATEAGAALLRIAGDSLRLRRLSAGHFLDNPASGRVLEKLGFRPTGTIAPRFSAGRGEEAPCRLFELDLSESVEVGEAGPAAVAPKAA